jgi:hypothetical protein
LFDCSFGVKETCFIGHTDWTGFVVPVGKYTNIELERGVNHTMVLYYKDASTGLPIDLTGWSAKLSVKPWTDKVPALNLATENYVPQPGEVSPILPDVYQYPWDWDMSTFPKGNWYNPGDLGANGNPDYLNGFHQVGKTTPTAPPEPELPTYDPRLYLSHFEDDSGVFKPSGSHTAYPFPFIVGYCFGVIGRVYVYMDGVMVHTTLTSGEPSYFVQFGTYFINEHPPIGGVAHTFTVTVLDFETDELIGPCPPFTVIYDPLGDPETFIPPPDDDGSWKYTGPEPGGGTASEDEEETEQVLASSLRGITLGEDGSITIKFSAKDSDTDKWRQAPYDLVLVDPEGSITKRTKGFVTILASQSVGG